MKPLLIILLSLSLSCGVSKKSKTTTTGTNTLHSGGICGGEPYRIIFHDSVKVKKTGK